MVRIQDKSLDAAFLFFTDVHFFCSDAFIKLQVWWHGII